MSKMSKKNINASSRAKTTLYIRWLGAYGKGDGTLLDSLNYEFSRDTPFALESISSGIPSKVPGNVGLLIDKKTVYRRFKGDIWSFYENGKLTASRKTVSSCRSFYGTHTECWANPAGGLHIAGVVIKKNWFELQGKTRRDIIAFCSATSIPLYSYVSGMLKILEV